MIASSLVAAISTSGIRWCRTVLLLALWRGPPEGTSDIWNFVYTWDISTSIKDSKRSNHFWYLLGRHLGFLVKDLLPLICNPAIFRKCHQSASRYRLWRWKWIRIGNPVSTRSPPKYNGFIPLSASFVNSARWLYEKCCRKMPYSAVIKKKKRGFLFGMRIFDRITAKI